MSAEQTALNLTVAEASAFIALLARCRKRPDLYFRHVLGVHLRTWQMDVCRRMTERMARGDKHLKVLVRSAHGSGKTFLLAGLTIWFMSTRPRARGLTTAPSWSGVENLLWPEIAGLYNNSILRTAGFGRLLSTELDFGDGYFVVGAAADRPERLEGHHSPTAALRAIDEGKAVPSGVFVSTAGMLNAPESLDIWISTPSIATGEFFERDASTDESVIRAVVTVDDLIADPLILKAEREGYAAWKTDCARDWGEASATFQSRCMARYIDDAEGALFPLSWVDRAMAAEFEVPPDGFGEPAALVLGMDVAGSADGDQNALALVGGPDAAGRLEVKYLASWNETDTMVSKGRALEAARRFEQKYRRPVTLRVDVIGIGAGVKDQLHHDGADVQAYRASSRAQGDRYFNRKAADAWGLRERLEKGTIRLPKDQRLRAQLVAMKYVITTQGKIRVEDPTPSPDLVDAVLIALYRPSESIVMLKRLEYSGRSPFGIPHHPAADRLPWKV